MVPEQQLLPDVFPTDRLMATGMAVPVLRAELRQMSPSSRASA
jgi:hypothetical protein